MELLNFVPIVVHANTNLASLVVALLISATGNTVLIVAITLAQILENAAVLADILGLVIKVKMDAL